jgi:hypothetical protein
MIKDEEKNKIRKNVGYEREEKVEEKERKEVRKRRER